MNITNEIQFYFGLLPTVLGWLIYASTIYFLFKGKRNSMWTSFAVGSFLMSSGLIISNLLPEDESRMVGVSWFLSAFVWLIFGAIVVGCYEVMKMERLCTEEQVINNLDGGKSLSEYNSLVGFWIARDSNYQRGGDFKYLLVEVYEVDTPLSGIRGEPLYSIRRLQGDLSSEEDAREYFDKYQTTPIKLQ